MNREEQIIKIGAQFAIDETDGQTSGRAASMRGVLLSAFRAGAKWADSHPHWIPVEEELPKFDEQVLVYGLCPNGCRLFYVDCLIQDINDNGYPKWDDDTIIPTHWMEIVPPRKEE